MSRNPTVHEITVWADVGSPVQQVRTAMNRLANAMGNAGLRPSGLVWMEWSTAEPARYHLARREIDLAYREVFAGNRPPIQLQVADHGLKIFAKVRANAPTTSDIVWRGLDLRTLEQQMSPRHGTPCMEAVFERKRLLSSHFREQHTSAAYDIGYGESAAETFDLFYPSHALTPPLWVFIHGGYWQASDKSDVHDLAQQMLAAGYAVAMPNYALCPPANLLQIVDQMHQSLTYIFQNAESLGIDREEIHIAGTSAGGHLAALMACERSLPFVRSALAISGIHDLRPLLFLASAAILGLDSELAARLSPILQRPNDNIRVGVAVGQLESDEFRHMSAELAQAWGADLMEVEGKTHFNVTDHLADGGALAQFAQTIAAKKGEQPC